jgi:steroid 5-alpha reductase family enzyme
LEEGLIMLNYWILIAIFFGVSALCCSVGFKKFVYFLSVGYGLSVIGLGIAYIVNEAIVVQQFDLIGTIQCLLFVFYGVRLAGFLLYREIKNSQYRKVLEGAEKETNTKKVPIFVSFVIWIVCAFLYVMQTSPVLSRMYNGDIWFMGQDFVPGRDIMPLVGIVISIIGIVIESIADKQKSAQKKQNPHMVATKGLYKMVRCPNYFGEILFWTGVFVGGVTTYANHVGQWILAVLGYICIVYVMINGAQRLDKRQEKNYGQKEEYRAYADHTPIILPLIPISHIGNKYKEQDKK